MPETLYDKDGNEVEAQTPEEVQAEMDAAVEERLATYINENPDAEETIKLKQELETAKGELEKLKGKDTNFGELRKAKEAAEKKVEELTNKIDVEIAGLKTELLGYGDSLEVLSGGDDELKKKIEFHYNRIKDPADTKKDIEKKLRDAYLLAAGTQVPDTLNRAINSNGGGFNRSSSNNKQFTPGQIEVAKKLGLSEEDLKNHSK